MRMLVQRGFTRSEALLVREDLYFNQKCQFNQADALLHMFYFLVCPVKGRWCLALYYMKDSMKASHMIWFKYDLNCNIPAAIPFNVKLSNLLEDASNHRALGRVASVFDIATFIRFVSDHKVMTSMTVPCRCSFSIPLKIITKNTSAVICLSKPGRSSQQGAQRCFTNNTNKPLRSGRLI